MSHAIERAGLFAPSQRPKLIDRLKTFAEAVYVAESECRWNVIVPGVQRSSAIDVDRFGELPIHSEQGLRCLADESVRFLDNVVATDKFKKAHSKRRKWRDGLSGRMGFGFDLKKHFKSNRLSGNGITCLVSGANIAERRLITADPDLVATPDVQQALGVIREIQAIPGDRFADRYIGMTNRQKMAVAIEVSSMAEEFLGVVNPPKDRKD